MIHYFKLVHEVRNSGQETWIPFYKWRLFWLFPLWRRLPSGAFMGEWSYDPYATREAAEARIRTWVDNRWKRKVKSRESIVITVKEPE